MADHRPPPPAGSLALLKAKSANRSRPSSTASHAGRPAVAAAAPALEDDGSDSAAGLMGAQSADVEDDVEDMGAAPEPRKMRKCLSWYCHGCKRECLPIREESRCMCGHRMKEHHPPGSDKTPLRCKNGRCSCKGFFYIVAEGSWILRCRCKHKHVEHDPNTHACTKPACAGKCQKFESPWVCNCDHPWAQHEQIIVERPVLTIEELAAGGGLAPGDIQNPHGVQRGVV